MHELPLTNKILDIGIGFAEKNKATEIKAINLIIGELNDIEDVWLNRYFQYISKGTIAHNAVLNIRRISIGWKCETCSKEFKMKDNNKEPVCPKCKDKKNLSLQSGREFFVDSISII